MTNEISICACCYICYLLHLNTLAFACLPFFSVSMDTNSQQSERRGMMIQSLLQFLLVLKGLRLWRINAVEFYVCKKLLHTFSGESAEYGESWYFSIVIAKVKYFKSQWLLFVKSRRCWKYEIKPSDTCFITRMKFDVSPLELVTIQETAAFDQGWIGYYLLCHLVCCFVFYGIDGAKWGF